MPQSSFSHHCAVAISETFLSRSACCKLFDNATQSGVQFLLIDRIICSILSSFCVMTLLIYCGRGSKVESLKEESILMDFFPRISDLLLSAEPCGMP